MLTYLLELMRNMVAASKLKSFAGVGASTMADTKTTATASGSTKSHASGSTRSRGAPGYRLEDDCPKAFGLSRVVVAVPQSVVVVDLPVVAVAVGILALSDVVVVVDGEGGVV